MLAKVLSCQRLLFLHFFVIGTISDLQHPNYPVRAAGRRPDTEKRRLFLYNWTFFCVALSEFCVDARFFCFHESLIAIFLALGLNSSFRPSPFLHYLVGRRGKKEAC